MFSRFRYFVIAALLLLSSSLFLTSAAYADTACTADISPSLIPTDQNSTFLELDLTNTGDSDINWINIIPPSADYPIVAGSAPSGWDSTLNTSAFTIFGNDLFSGDELSVSIGIQTGDNTTSPANWEVQVEDPSAGGPGGSGPVDCGGNLSTAINNNVGLPAPVISNVMVSDITTSSAELSWQTDEATSSEIDYGLDTTYGLSKTDGNLATDHNIELDHLQPGSGYHYQIVATDSSGTPTSSGDNTFLTVALPPVPPKVVSNTTNPEVSAPINVIVTDPEDKTPPTISLNGQLPKVVRSLPTISGTAADNLAVVRIEYSTDGGQNWLPVDSAPELGAKQVSFSFTPQGLDDGNYTILARAIDPGGNITTTPAINVVLDQLPPIIGGQIISLGPQVLQPDSSGTIKTLAGIDQKITLSAVGGPTSINLEAQPLKSQTKISDFSLTQSQDSGLWSGILSFDQPGTYNIVANAVDGADNHTSRNLITVQVNPSSIIVNNTTNKPIIGAKVSVYSLESESNSWALWDGAAYSQTNPQTSDKNGNFSLLLPAGEYYLTASARSYHKLTSDIFKLNQTTPLSVVLKMKAGRLGPIDIPWLDFSTQKLNLSSTTTAPAKNNLIGNTSPNFSLSTTNGKTLQAEDLLGRPTDLVVLATWAPTTSEQLPALSKLQNNQDINIEPVGLGQDTGQLQAYNQIGGYQLNWLGDPNNSLVDSLHPGALPTHYFIDRDGVIRQVVSGVLSQQQILDDLSSL